MRSTLGMFVVYAALAGFLTEADAVAQIAFSKSEYYVSAGDSLGAGHGALPVTRGFAFLLYDRGVFGKKQIMDFSNIAITGASSQDVQLFQVPQLLCIQPPRINVPPSVITLTAGAGDLLIFFATNGIPPNPLVAIPALADEIAGRVETIIRSLVFGSPGLPSTCAVSGIPGVTVLVSNYYDLQHPDPQIDFLVDLALESFNTSLAARIAQIQADIATSGRSAQVALVDTQSAFGERRGLLLHQKRLGFTGLFDFEIHPTNAGHSVIAQEFARVWKSLQTTAP